MKKIFLFLLFAITSVAFSQTMTTPSFPTIKLTKLESGSGTDDVIVIGVNKQLKKVAKSVITDGLATTTQLANKENTIAPGTTSQYWRGDKTWQTLDKAAVGLGNVDNTTDAAKPISTATQAALDTTVKLTGDQNIGGNKFFQKPLVWTNQSTYSIPGGHNILTGNGTDFTLGSFSQTGSIHREAKFIYEGSSTSFREYILPSSNGTLALLSDVNSKLNLTGGTLTGTTSMNGGVAGSAPITMIYDQSVNRLLAPILRLYGATNISSNYVELDGLNATSNRLIKFPDVNGTVIVADSNGNISSKGLSVNNTASSQSLNFLKNSSLRYSLGTEIGTGTTNDFGIYNYIAGATAMTIYANNNYHFFGSQISDRRTKQGIKDFTFKSIDKILELKPKSYFMINDSKQIRYGFIAQDVNDVLPDLVRGDINGKDFIGLDYNGFIPVLVKAIQEQQAQIKELKAEIEILKNKQL